MGAASRSVAVAIFVVLGAAPAFTADQEVLGKRLLLRDPHGVEERRSVTIVGRETATDVPAIAGDPVVSGATLMIGVDGGSAGAFHFLDASGWSATATGYRYAGPTSTGDPVRKVVLRRSAAGTMVVEILLKGSVGTHPVDLVPPNPGSDAVAVLAVANGDTYCVSFGGAAGGTVITNTAATWRMANATAQPACPGFCCSFGSSCGWGDAIDAPFCPELGGTLAPPGAACDAATGACAPPPVGAGNCCEFAGGALCFGGPSVQQPPCDEVGGTFFTQAVCDSTEGCVVP